MKRCVLRTVARGFLLVSLVAMLGGCDGDGGDVTTDPDHLWSLGFGGDSGGEHVWSRGYEVTGDAEYGGWSVTTDSEDNVLMTGCFQDTLDLGGGPLTSGDNVDIFLFKRRP